MEFGNIGQPVATPEEMAEIDQAAIAEIQARQGCTARQALELLIERAGEATATVAREMLGLCYGKRVLILAGPGNNGNDGRSAARRLRLWGAQVVLMDAADGGGTPIHVQKHFDLLIDAAYGTGLSRPHRLPAGLAELVRNLSTLAVDIVSGVDGLTGEVLGDALAADQTVTFGALKPGHLLGEGRQLCGRLQVADIGLDASQVRTRLVGPRDLKDLLPGRDPQAHKYVAACWVVGGSPGMSGAVALAARGALRAGAGYVRVSLPGQSGATQPSAAPTEAVEFALPKRRWGKAVLKQLRQSSKFHSLVVGPGLVPTSTNRRSLHTLVDWFVQTGKPATLVLDGGALQILGQSPRRRLAPNIVVTPHDQEFQYLTGQRPGPNRIAACRQLAGQLNSIVLLKGPTTVVAHPDGRVLLSSAGDQRLATAGTGDVLSGIIGSLAAQGLSPFLAAALGAELHGQASRLAAPRGLIAGDLPELLPELAELLVRPDFAELIRPAHPVP